MGVISRMYHAVPWQHDGRQLVLGRPGPRSSTMTTCWTAYAGGNEHDTCQPRSTTRHYEDVLDRVRRRAGPRAQLATMMTPAYATTTKHYDDVLDRVHNGRPSQA